MIDIPLNKALVAVEAKKIINQPGSKFVGDPGHKSNCDECFFDKFYSPLRGSPCGMFPCSNKSRKDGKNVIFQLVDYPPDPSLKVMTGIINKFSNPPLTTEEVDALLKKMETGEAV